MHDVDVDQIPLSEWEKKDGVPKADYEECLRITRGLMESTVHKPTELNSREVMAISYYFDRSTDHGLVGEFLSKHIFVYKKYESYFLINYL